MTAAATTSAVEQSDASTSSQRATAVGLRLGSSTVRAATRTSAFDALRVASTPSRTTTTDPLLRGIEQALAATRAQGSIDVLIAQRLLALS